jgi:hypothetical protein
MTAQEILKGIRNDVLAARLNFDIFRIYKEPRTRAQYWRVLTTYQGFFATSILAHLDACVAALGRVFDNDPRNLCIKTLETHASVYATIEATTLMAARDLWTQKSRKLRNMIVAHHASAMTAKDALDIADVDLDDMERLISLCETLVDAWTRHAACYMDLSPASKADTTKMLDTLLKMTE